ncbi:hypothetical protein Taro_025297 [Colocasia esculenta]|uniref:BURP domain-containing protein n=1 Tax=Colocasia esculenta TaxID=4460 RepID=A0A843VG56_COLES|nr:hypothetical protein [Colocasia esculenta]
MGSKLRWWLLLSLLFVVELGSSLGASDNPFSPRASLLRQWNRLFPSDQIPSILLSKASPLNASQVAVFSRYIDDHTLPAHVQSFCSAANLFCDVKLPANVTHDVSGDADFSSYSNKQFRRYQSNAVFGNDAFRNYSVGENVGRDVFVRYGKDGTGGTQTFTNYAADSNVAGSDFANYDSRGNGMIGSFSSYGTRSNVQGHNFATYSSDSSGDSQLFSSYSEESNVVKNDFKTYGGDANGFTSQFSGYSTSSNVGTNSFKGYGGMGNGATDFFRNYGDKINIAHNDFQTYGDDSNGPLENFASYGEQASQSDNQFRSYGKGTNELGAIFSSYGNSTVTSKNEFVEYNKDATSGALVQFSNYVGNQTTFKQYIGTPGSFSGYFNTSEATSSAVEPGKFFRQANLAAGKGIPMPDIRDKMPPRSFLPRVLAEKFPFSSGRLPELVGTLGASELRGIMAKTIAECERPAVKDETKRCVTSLEGMAEFAVSVLGKAAAVSTTASTAGWGKTLVVGKVAPRHGGRETRSVSCHQSLFPYLVYYCHAVPRVAVYDVDLLEMEGGAVVNKGVAICHLDTSQWSSGHAAFVALGPAPGKIEVCHWIFENDLIWVARAP